VKRPWGSWSNKRGESASRQWLLDRVDYDGSDCLIWPFSRLPSGRGNFGYEGKQYQAHRYMCELVNGPPPTLEHETRHTCGRGHDACVHPRHLIWGTRTENERDKVAHGRASWQAGRSRFKLTVDQVHKIRADYPATTVAELARVYSVSESNIRKILKFETWPHLAAESV
jgi:hypothetical protein